MKEWDNTTLSNIQKFRDEISTANLIARNNYDHNWDNWNKDRVLRAATYPKPLPPLPEPILFTQEITDDDLVGEIFINWAALTIALAKDGQPSAPGYEKPDYSPATRWVRYVRPVVVVVTPDQPANPLGTPMDENEPVIAFGLAPGDKNPKGFVYTDGDGNKYIKIIRTGFGGHKEQRYNLLDENGNPVDPSK